MASILKSKFQICTQSTVHVTECLRRIQNTSKDADWDECVVPVLNDYVGRMKAAGYREDQRKHVLLNALAIYDKKVMLDSEGKIPLNPTYHGLQLYLLIMGWGGFHPPLHYVQFWTKK